MSDSTSIKMAELLPLPPPAAEPLWPWLLAGCVVLLLALGLWTWRRARDPYRRLASGLSRGRLDARQAAHALAALGGLSPEQQQQLERLRFARQAPQAQQLQQLLQDLRDGR